MIPPFSPLASRFPSLRQAEPSNKSQSSSLFLLVFHYRQSTAPSRIPTHSSIPANPCRDSDQLPLPETRRSRPSQARVPRRNLTSSFKTRYKTKTLKARHDKTGQARRSKGKKPACPFPFPSSHLCIDPSHQLAPHPAAPAATSLPRTRPAPTELP